MKRSIRTFLSLAIFSLSVDAAAFPNDQDPLLTEKSAETFTVDMDGFPLTLPVELKNRTLPEKVSTEQTNLSIGSIDVAYKIKDEKTGKLTIVKSWVEFQGGSQSCDAEKRLDKVRENFAKYDIKSRIEQVTNEKFEGYLVTAEYASKGTIHGIYLEVFNKKISRCFTVSLAVDKLGDFTNTDLRTSLSPLVDPIKKSMSDYAKKGAAQ